MGSTSVHRPIYTALREVFRNIGRNNPISKREPLLGAIDLVGPHVDDLRLLLLDWGEASSEWIENFHIQLDDYVQIVATDMAERSSLESPRFGRYLRNQFHARLTRLRGQSDGILTYSKNVYEAILRTGWRPGETLWGEHKIVAASSADH